MTGKGRAPKSSLSAPSPLEILRRPQHQGALDLLSVEMLEVPRGAGEKKVGLAVNTGQQNWLVLWLEANVSGKFETLTRIDN
jgi:hypothetical protein